MKRFYCTVYSSKSSKDIEKPTPVRRNVWIFSPSGVEPAYAKPTGGGLNWNVSQILETEDSKQPQLGDWLPTRYK